MSGDLTTYTIILFFQYGGWSATSPFSSRQDAERHADKYFRKPKKDYVSGLIFLEVELPAYPKEKELGNYSFNPAEEK